MTSMPESVAPRPDGREVTVRAPAKINLHLGVGPARPDGFHPLCTVYQAIGLYDDVTAAPAAAWGVDVEPVGDVDVADVPLDDSNLAVRAGRLLLEHHGRDDAAHLSVSKGIPVAGGLAGGSADAAAALVAVDRLFDLGTPDDDLLALAGELGSDVPFALIGGTALGEGRGELVTPVADHGAWWWVVLPSGEGLSTPAVYREYDAGHPGDTERPDALLAALESGDPEQLAAALRNDLESPAFALRPDLPGTRATLEATSAAAVLLSGSGPTLLALARDAEHAREVVGELGDVPVLYAPGPVHGAHVLAGEA